MQIHCENFLILALKKRASEKIVVQVQEAKLLVQKCVCSLVSNDAFKYFCRIIKVNCTQKMLLQLKLIVRNEWCYKAQSFVE